MQFGCVLGAGQRRVTFKRFVGTMVDWPLSLGFARCFGDKPTEKVDGYGLKNSVLTLIIVSRNAGAKQKNKNFLERFPLLHAGGGGG